jgi:hypothetical protein
MVLVGFIVVVGSVGIPRAANRAQNIVLAEIRVWSEHYSGKFLIRFGHPCGDTCLSGKYQRDVGIPETVRIFVIPAEIFVWSGCSGGKSGMYVREKFFMLKIIGRYGHSTMCRH